MVAIPSSRSIISTKYRGKRYRKRFIVAIPSSRSIISTPIKKPLKRPLLVAIPSSRSIISTWFMTSECNIRLKRRRNPFKQVNYFNIKYRGLLCMLKKCRNPFKQVNYFNTNSDEAYLLAARTSQSLQAGQLFQQTERVSYKNFDNVAIPSSRSIISTIKRYTTNKQQAEKSQSLQAGQLFQHHVEEIINNLRELRRNPFKQVNYFNR